MNFWQAVILGLVQGMAEFLPVSSSGHLVIGQILFGIEEPPILFDILVHIGTLVSIIIYFNKKIFSFFLKKRNFLLVAVGSVPAALGGIILTPILEQVFNSLKVVGVCLIVTSALLFSTRFVRKLTKDFKKLRWQDSLIIGFFQALALLPGISRSGATISGAVFRGFKRDFAFVFSFYLGAPAFVGALMLQCPDIAKNIDQLGWGIVGMVIAGISGYFSLKILEKAVIKNRLCFFAVYCFLLGVILLV